MAHYAKIGLDNIVEEIVRVDNKDCVDAEAVFDEQLGVNYLINLTGHTTWVRCSINTHGGKHYDPDTMAEDDGTPLRLNYPGIGWKYDSTLDGFIQPEMEGYSNWVLNSSTGLREAPVAYPDDGNRHRWDDENSQWVQMDESEYYV